MLILYQLQRFWSFFSLDLIFVGVWVVQSGKAPPSGVHFSFGLKFESGSDVVGLTPIQVWWMDNKFAWEWRSDKAPISSSAGDLKYLYVRQTRIQIASILSSILELECVVYPKDILLAFPYPLLSAAESSILQVREFFAHWAKSFSASLPARVRKSYCFLLHSAVRW